MATTAQLNARAANAQHSTGPRSPEGKAASSSPAKLPAGLDQFARDCADQYPPRPDETRLLDDLVRGIWLERRYTRIETEIIDLRFAALPEEQRPFALGAIYLQDAEGPNLLPKIERRRAAAQRQAQRARARTRTPAGHRLAHAHPPHPRAFGSF